MLVLTHNMLLRSLRVSYGSYPLQSLSCINFPPLARFIFRRNNSQLFVAVATATATRSLSSNGSISENDNRIQNVTPSPPSRRQRHRSRFGSSVEKIPTFREFQQKQQVRNLYRQFIRLVRKESPDLHNQIRQEFRLSQRTTTDHWNIQRSLSEGLRRYKELVEMLGSSKEVEKMANTRYNNENKGSMNESVSNDNIETTSNTASPTMKSPPVAVASVWPWNFSKDLPKRPLPLPPKSK